MSFNIVNPPAIIATAPVRSETGQQQENIKFKEKLQRQLFTGKIDKRGPDGRTYNFIDSNGNYNSSFLSPYNKKILENVEPGVKDLISILIKRGYLTAGSCQGHPNDKIHKTFDRWIMIAFISEEERSQFIDKINSYKLPVFWYFNFLNTIEYPKKDEQREGMTLHINMQDKIYRSIDDQRQQEYTIQDLTDYWNIMFGRNYQKYYPVMMCICSCPGDISLVDKIKIFLTWPLREYYTKKLVKKIQNISLYNW